MCGLVIKKNFSVVHRLQRFLMLIYGFALARIDCTDFHWLHIFVIAFSGSLLTNLETNRLDRAGFTREESVNHIFG